MTGVIAVATGDDLRQSGCDVPAVLMVPGMKIPPHPLLARGAVHAVGTPVAAVVAEKSRPRPWMLRAPSLWIMKRCPRS